MYFFDLRLCMRLGYFLMLLWQQGLVTKYLECLDEHHCDVIMGAMASPITSLAIVYSAVYSGVDSRKHQNSATFHMYFIQTHLPQFNEYRIDVCFICVQSIPMKKIIVVQRKLMFSLLWLLNLTKHSLWFRLCIDANHKFVNELGHYCFVWLQ